MVGFWETVGMYLLIKPIGVFYLDFEGREKLVKIADFLLLVILIMPS